MHLVRAIGVAGPARSGGHRQVDAALLARGRRESAWYWRNASSTVGTTFSIPMITTYTRGSDDDMRPLPSLVTMQIVPVSAMAKLQPLMPMSAPRNSRRSRVRATPQITCGIKRRRHVQLFLEEVGDVLGSGGG